MTYDPKCHALATDWLDEDAPEADIQSLASAIQQAIEDWQQDRNDDRDRDEDDGRTYADPRDELMRRLWGD